MFHRIVKRLQMNTSMVQSEIVSTDYTSDGTRVTSCGNTSYAIQKELGFAAVFPLPDMPLVSLRCALSYEHPSPLSWDMDDVVARYTSRRQKHRWRFVHRETVAIDCTYVQTTVGDAEVDVDSYEIEIELLRSARYKHLTPDACGGLVMSLVWRMLLCVLDVPVETTNIGDPI